MPCASAHRGKRSRDWTDKQGYQPASDPGLHLHAKPKRSHLISYQN